MPVKRSKRYEKAAALVTEGSALPLPEAVEVLKKFPAPKFDPTVTVSMHLGIDPRKSDQMVRGSVSLPHGTGKNVRVVVFATGDAAKAAEAAGADQVGMEELIKEVQGGFTDFDVAIATPEAMTEVRKIARVLGPRGLMPNPKTGTVTNDTAEAVNASKAGKVDYKVDKGGNIAAAVGKGSFDSAKLIENASAFIESVTKSKPASAKGAFVKSVTIASSMCPGVKVESTEQL